MAEASTTYPGKIFLYTQNPQALLDAGYEEIAIERRPRKDKPWKEITKEGKTRLCIEAGVFNYWYIDDEAELGFEYRAVVIDKDGVEPDIPQPPQDAVDATFEKVLTIQELKDIYLYGQEGVLTTDGGVPIPDYVYAHYIQAGIAKFEQKTDLCVCPKRIVERQDWDAYGGSLDDTYIPLDKWPVIGVESVKLILPGSTADNPTFAYPESWIELFKEHGQLHLVPDGVSGSPFLTTGHFLGGHMRGRKFLANAYEVIYFAGFELGTLPANLKDMIGKEAAAGPLNVGGDLIGGAGIASRTISMDGLSESINTTSSATNAGFGARLIQYNKELKEAYPEIIRFYKGIRALAG